MTEKEVTKKKLGDPIITKHFIPTVDDNGIVEVDLLISLSQKAIHAGLIKRVGQRGFCVLVVLASYMNKNNVSYPSQTKIVELIGMSRPTVAKAINDLVEVGVVETVSDGRKNTYKINFTALKTLHVIEDKEEDEPVYIPEEVFATSKDVANYFADKYRAVYGVPYTINFGRDLALIKTKILGKYTDVDIKKAIDTAVENYADEWANANYLRPTIPMLATWLINDALAFSAKANQDKDQLHQRIKDAEMADMTDVALKLF